jgi:hypothetical protein
MSVLNPVITYKEPTGFVIELQNHGGERERFQTVAQAFFHGQSAFFSCKYAQERCLTPSITSTSMQLVQ